jgi:oligopeptide transport system ATP-binding protein
VNAAPLLSVKDLQVHFGAGRKLFGKSTSIKAIDGVSFELKEGETLGIVGESGCGKSTLGRAILRLLEPTAGAVVWLGKDMAHLEGEALRRERRNMQVIFQDPIASLDPRMTVGQAIERPLVTFEQGLSGRERRERVHEMMELVGLPRAWSGRYPHELSGGQCQRVGIARAMILRPKLVVCDEPVSALDVSIQAQIINLLMRLQRELGLSLLFISHNLSVVRHISNRVMVLYLGKVMEIADRDDLYARQLHPYTKALMSAVPIPDPRLERQREKLLLTGDLPSPVNPPSGCRFRTRCPIATPRCAAEEPALRPFGNGHLVACHYAGEKPA